MVKIDSSAWPDERLREQTIDSLRILRDNAERLGSADLAARCTAEIARRATVKRSRAAVATKRSGTAVVVGYHFVCQGDWGVTLLGSGRFATASWVVAEDRVKASLVTGAYVAIHETRADRSYRQGRLVGYNLKPRDMLHENGAKIRMGIEFLVESTDQSYDWVGDATGEKGYLWSDGVATGGDETEGSGAAQ